MTRSASCPDRETAQWATQQVVTANEQAVHRCLAQNTRSRLTAEAAWPSREEAVGRAGHGAIYPRYGLKATGSDVTGIDTRIRYDSDRNPPFTVMTSMPYKP
ncbi:RNase A-like domain-containing protein [Streptomyces clavifer]|uniref:RNase A-like domain-containing protein n=1 Tax=Streptomyces clavifer TaxID=68188 RepID=UPI003D9E8D5F